QGTRRAVREGRGPPVRRGGLREDGRAGRRPREAARHLRPRPVHGQVMLSDTAWFALLLAVVGFVAGAIASVSGFGIGSLLTPVLAVRVGTKLAVAAVSVRT